MNKLKFIFIFVCLLFKKFSVLHAQSTQSYIQQATIYASQQQHFEALICWELAYKKDKKNPQILFGQAAAWAETAQYTKSLAAFKKLRYKAKKADICYYLGYLYQQTGKHKEANLYYRLFLKIAKKNHHKRRLAKIQLAQIPHAQRLNLSEPNAVVVPLAELNSQYDDYNLCAHPRLDSLHLFNSNRPLALFKKSNPNLKKQKKGQKKSAKKANNNYVPNLNANVWAAALNDADWKPAQPLNLRYNSEKDDYLLGFLDNGYQIIYRSGTKLLIDNFDADTMRLSLDFNPDLYQMEWAGDFFFYGEKLLIFAAKASDSYGGTDLYWSWKNMDETWTIPQNLGAEINTEKDEKSPFLATDGRTLYFSSRRSEGLGGFDVYKSNFIDEKLIWAASSPLPYPINSPADDLYFKPQNDGISAFLSSNREGSLGGYDLYTVYLKKYLPEQEIFSNPASFAEVFLQKQADTLAQIPPIGDTISQAQKILYEINPIFYPTALVPTEEMRNQGEILAKILAENANLELFVSAHADNQGERELDLYMCAKQSQMMANILIEMGINADRIHLLGGGSAYPIAKNENFKQEALAEGQQLNRRIEFMLFDKENMQPIGQENLDFVRINTPQVSQLLQSPEGKVWEAAQQGFYYAIELKKTANLWRNEVLKREKNIYVYQSAGAGNLYYLQGFYTDFVEAEKALQMLQKKYQINNCKLSAFYAKKPITAKEIPFLLSKYPDLAQYLAYLQK